MSITLSEAWVKKTPVTAAVQVSGALSVSFSYWQIFGARNVESIADAMHQLTGVPEGLVMTLKRVDWHEVIHVAVASAMPHVKPCYQHREFFRFRGLSRELPTIPSRNRPQVMLVVYSIAACREMSSKPPKSSELDEQNSELSEFRHTVSRKIILLADIIPTIIIVIYCYYYHLIRILPL